MSQKSTDTENPCTFPRCECMCHPKDCVFKPENQVKKTFIDLDEWSKLTKMFEDLDKFGEVLLDRHKNKIPEEFPKEKLDKQTKE